MKNTKRALCSPFVNVVPAEYENWLEKMAEKGWHVDHIGQWSSICMTFKRGEPKKYRFVYDLQAFPKKDYKATYEQFGWEFVGQMASAFIWRREYTDERPESFTDMESLEKRSKRVAAAVLVNFILFLLITIIIAGCFIANYHRLNTEGILQFVLGLLLSGAFTMYLGYVMKNIYKNKQK